MLKELKNEQGNTLYSLVFTTIKYNANNFMLHLLQNLKVEDKDMSKATSWWIIHYLKLIFRYNILLRQCFALTILIDIWNTVPGVGKTKMWRGKPVIPLWYLNLQSQYRYKTKTKNSRFASTQKDHTLSQTMNDKHAQYNNRIR